MPEGWRGSLFMLALLGGAPSWALAAWLVWQQPWLVYPKVLLLVVSGAVWLGAAWRLRVRDEFQRITIANVVEGMAAGDYSLRLRRPGGQDPLGRQINRLADTLHRQRLRSEEALRMVDCVVDSIDVAIYAFDRDDRLVLANPTARALLQREHADMLGQTAQALGLAALLHGDTEPLREHVFPGAAGLWQLRRQRYQVEGREHLLLFVTDLKQVLRSEELEAWRRLLRVLSHEVNNSLGPIASLSATLRKRLAGDSPLPEWRADLDEGLAIMEDRSRHLAEFVRRYAALARLPEPRKRPFDLAELLQKLPAMLPGAALRIEPPDLPALPFFGDPVQIEQLLINLLKNGQEANERQGGTALTLCCQPAPLQISVLDRGPGIANAANLFVPFYTTKPDGAGIGLVLSRQIAEAHGGSLTLENRGDGPGCAAVLRFARMDGAAQTL